MRTIKYRNLYGVDESSAPWENEELEKFIFLIPDLAMALKLVKIMPPLVALNELFSIGKSDAGMGGGVEWKQFEIEISEYKELVEYLCTDPKLNIKIDTSLEHYEKYEQWYWAAFKAHNPREKS